MTFGGTCPIDAAMGPVPRVRLDAHGRVLAVRDEGRTDPFGWSGLAGTILTEGNSLRTSVSGAWAAELAHTVLSISLGIEARLLGKALDECFSNPKRGRRVQRDRSRRRCQDW